MVVRYIVTRPIMGLFERSTRRPEARVSRRWWEHTGIDLKGGNKRAVESTTDSESYLGVEDSSGASDLSGVEWGGSEE